MCAVLVAPQPAAAKKRPPVPRVVRGQVLDAAENPIVGATVELKDLTSGKTQAIYSQDGGEYKFSGLERLHEYEVKAAYKGESSGVRKASSFDTRDTIVIYLHIPPQKEEQAQ